MTSPTGNKGFTLIEVMLAAAVLALGAVMVYQAFFVSLDYFNYSRTVLNIISWADEKIWAAQDSLEHLGPAAVFETNGQLANSDGKNIMWNLSAHPAGTRENLFQIDLRLSWPQGYKKMELSRSAYALYQEK